MKYLILSFLIVMSNFLAFSFDEEELLLEKNYFSYYITDSETVISKKLEKKVTPIKVARNDKEKFVTISPENQIKSEQLNLDYSFGFFDGELLSMTFYNRGVELFIELRDELLLKPKISKISGETVYEWIYPTLNVKCWVSESEDEVTYLIYNQAVAGDYDKHLEILMGDDPFY